MIVIIIISLIIYLIIYSSIYYRMPEIKKDKKIWIMGIFGVAILLITIILSNISGGAIQGYSQEKLKIAKTASVFIMAPINTFILLAPIAKGINKLKEKNINKEKFYKRLVIIGVIFAICLLIEKDYIQNFMQGLLLNS